jgi:hypothetical protein
MPRIRWTGGPVPRVVRGGAAARRRDGETARRRDGETCRFCCRSVTHRVPGAMELAKEVVPPWDKVQGNDPKPACCGPLLRTKTLPLAEQPSRCAVAHRAVECRCEGRGNAVQIIDRTGQPGNTRRLHARAASVASGRCQAAAIPTAGTVTGTAASAAAGWLFRYPPWLVPDEPVRQDRGQRRPGAGWRG